MINGKLSYCKDICKHVKTLSKSFCFNFYLWILPLWTRFLSSLVRNSLHTNKRWYDHVLKRNSGTCCLRLFLQEHHSVQGMWHHGWWWATMPLSTTHRLCNLVETYIINSALSLMFLELNYVESLEVTDTDQLCPWWVKLKRGVAKISSYGKSKGKQSEK